MKKYTHEEMVERGLISTVSIDYLLKNQKVDIDCDKPKGPKNSEIKDTSLGVFFFVAMAAAVVALVLAVILNIK